MAPMKRSTAWPFQPLASVWSVSGSSTIEDLWSEKPAALSKSLRDLNVNAAGGTSLGHEHQKPNRSPSQTFRRS